MHGLRVLCPGLSHIHTVGPCLCPCSVSLALLTLGLWDTTVWGFRALSLQGPRALSRVRGAISTSSTSQELLGTDSISKTPSPKCFASRRRHTWLGHTWLRAPPGSEGGGADAGWERGQEPPR